MQNLIFIYMALITLNWRYLWEQDKSSDIDK